MRLVVCANPTTSTMDGGSYQGAGHRVVLFQSWGVVTSSSQPIRLRSLTAGVNPDYIETHN